MPQYAHGDIITEKLIKIGSSYYLLISRDIIDYLGYEPEKEQLAIKFEKGKWGQYIGIGTKKQLK